MAPTKLRWALIGFALCCSLGASAWAEDNVPRVIAYQGNLERGGEPFNGDIEMTFSLYNGAVEQESLWVETQPVRVHAGRFTALLGSTSPELEGALAEVVRAANDLYLGLALRSGEVDIPMGGRQRFTPSPYALWTTAASDFDVAGDLSVGGEFICGGSAEVGGFLKVRGTDIEFVGDEEGRGDGGRALVHAAGDRLELNYDEDFEGGTKINGTLVIDTGTEEYRDGLVVKTKATREGAVKSMTIDGNSISTDFSTLTLSSPEGGVYINGGVYVRDGYIDINNGPMDNQNHGRALSADGDGKLVINRFGWFENGTTIDGTLLIKSSGLCDCQDYETNATNGANGGDFTDWTCPGNKVIAGFTQERDCGDGNDNCVNKVKCCSVCSFIRQ